MFIWSDTRSARLLVPLALLLGCGSADDSMAPPPDGGMGDPPMVERAFTIVVLPDTQIYARDFPDIFKAQTDWIAEQTTALNIVGVLHVGDIVDDNNEAQWAVAEEALSPLLGVVPLVLALGNHDYGDGGSANNRSTLLHDFLPVDAITSQPVFAGSMETDRLDNTFAVLDTPEGPWLVLALEFGPRDAVLEWASEVVAARSDMPAIVLTHAYLYSDDTRYDWASKGDTQRWSPHSYGLAALEPVNDGEEIFEKLVRPHPSIDFVLCGHVLNDGVARLASAQVDGGSVHELLANYQMNDMGGQGFLRLVKFRTGSPEVRVETYSPWLDEYKEDTDQQFTLMRNPP